MKASHAFLSQGSASTRQIVENKVRRIRDKTLAWDLTAAIISDEVLPGWVLYDDQDSVFTRLQRLMPVLEQSTPDCDHQFVFYTRDFNSWLRSGCWEKVRYARQSQELETWLDKVPFEKCWRVAQEELSSVVHSPVKFHDMYEDEKHGEPFGGYILHAAGVSRSVIDSLEWPERKNQSLPIGAQHFLLELNRSDLSNRAIRIVRQLVAANQRCFSRLAQVDGTADTPVNISDMYEDKKRSESLARYLLRTAGVSKRAIEAIEWPERKNQRFPHGTDNFLLELDQSGLSNNVLEIVRQLVVSNQQCFSMPARIDGPADG